MPGLYWYSVAAITKVRQRYARVRRRSAARFGGRIRAPKALISYPEPKSIGSFARGQQMLVGNFQLGGALIELPNRPIWDVDGAPLVIDDLHGCTWIDDLAATGHAQGRRLLQAWIAEWIRRFGAGHGPGWRPDLTGQRLIHWISHAITILQGQDKTASANFLRSVARQSRYLSQTWRAAPKGLPRMRALVGLVYAALALEGMQRDLKPALKRLGQECKASIGKDGTVPSRSPEELMEVFELLVWAAKVAEDAGHAPDPHHRAALERIAPTLRALRLGDGSLVRFHGGGRGDVSGLDQSLSDSGVKATPTEPMRMGFSRLAMGRTTIVVDTAPPPKGAASAEAHAATLALEMSSGRQPIIVNAGPGRYFGEDWRQASRQTACQSTLVLDGRSSANIWKEGFVSEALGSRISQGPRKVTVDRANDVTGVWILATHDGYLPDYGLTHDRRLFLSPEGKDIRGEDTLYLRQAADKGRYRAGMGRRDGVPFTVHFHVHPDVTASLDMSGHAVSLRLASDEVWVFRQSGGKIHLAETVFLDQKRLRPRPTKQIIVEGRTAEGRGQITWAMTRAQEGRPMDPAELDEMRS